MTFDKLPPLAQIGVGCVSSVPIDYMHNVLLGVFRTMLRLWLNNTTEAYYLRETQQNEINRRILSIKNQICCDFVRTPRKLSDLKWYKATELRLFLLYLGPFIFLQVMHTPYYNNFIKLHSAIRILCHPNLYETMNADAKNIIEAFARDFINLYGEKYFVYNFHLLTHLADDSQIHGRLDEFSAFAFENYLQLMLNYLKKAPYPLHQFRNRLGEHLKYGSEKSIQVIRQRGNAFLRITNQKQVEISIHGADRYVFENNNIYKVHRIEKTDEQYLLKCYKAKNLMALYVEPTDSRILGVYCCENVIYADDETSLMANNISKVLHIKLNGIHGFIIMLHSNCKFRILF